MTWVRSSVLSKAGHPPNRTAVFIFLCLLTLVFTRMGAAVDESHVPAAAYGDKEAWLVTFGPGQVYWERFGHNAIWLREPAAGLDHTFNFGYFDFEQENFLLRFVRGHMLYFSVAQAAEREFDFYQKYNRSIRLQKINLSDRQYERLRDYLLNEIKPENRYYRYDYYLNNCSTRVRDAIDLALDGGLSSRTQLVPAALNFRDQTRRLTQEQFWYYLGLELVLGYPTDRPVSRWDEMFIPMVLADEIAALSSKAVKPENAMIVQDIDLYSSTAPQPGAQPSSTWPRYLLTGLLVVGLAWLSGKFMPPVWLAGLSGAWVLICFTNGLILAGLWCFTDHEVARLNANLLFFNPLVIVVFIPSLHRLGAAVFAGGVVVAAALLLLPKHQYNLDVLALLAPVNLAAGVYLYRNKLTQKPA